MIEKINRVLTKNYILSLLPLVGSILTNLCIFIVCIMGENTTHIDGYATMGIITMGLFIYIPIWAFAVLLYIVLWILLMIFTTIALGCSTSNKKSNMISTNRTANIFSYIMVVWLLLYSVLEIISIFVLLCLCYNAIVFLSWCFVSAIYMGSFIMFIYFTILHTTYITEFKQTQMTSVIKRE